MRDLRLERAMRLRRRLAHQLQPAVPVDAEAAQRAIAEDLDREQRDLLGRCWSGRCSYRYLAQSPADTLVLRSLIELGLVVCPEPGRDVKGPDTSSRGRAVIGKLPRP